MVVPVFGVASVVVPPSAPAARVRLASRPEHRSQARGSSAKALAIAATLSIAGVGLLWMFASQRPKEETVPVAVEAPAESTIQELSENVVEAEPVAQPESASEFAEKSGSLPEPRRGENKLYVLKRFTGDGPEGLSVYEPGDEVTLEGQKGGYFVVSDGTGEVRRPRSWFTRDTNVAKLHKPAVSSEPKVASSEKPGSLPQVVQKPSPVISPSAEKAPQSGVKTSPSAQSSAPPGLVAAAKKIDALIAAHHAKNNFKKPNLVGDERFLRRAYLVGIGRIPTSEETKDFLEESNPNKRSNLIAALMQSPGYASHMTNWMFDRLRMVDYNNVAQIRYPVYRQWVREAVNQDMPWDKMVSELLTTNGGGWDEDSAAIGYFTRDRGMPLDNLAVTMRIFLGSRMECAQCHDDPFGDTKQKDFFRLAAFANGLEPMKQDLFYGIFREMDAMPQTSVEHRAAWMFWRDIYGSSLAGGGTGRIALPTDYKYKDGRPGDIEGARAPFGKVTNLAGTRDRDDGREKLAEWITLGTGDRFASMIANAMWRRVMGAGYYEPGDEYLETSETYDPAISSHLANLMVDQKYSLRDFQQTLMLTEVFQFEANSSASLADGGADDFRGRRVKRMTAEQIWDSLVTLVSGNPDNQSPPPADQRIFIDGAPVLEGQMTMAQLSREVMAIKNERKLRQYFIGFVEKVKADREVKSGEESAAALMRRDPVGFVRGTLPRAADLPSPAPRNHFVALFGQSNRNVVDGSTREPNMAQVLSLMNGFVQAEVVNKPDAHLNQDVAGAGAAEDKIRQLYLAIFSRNPNAEETSLMAEEFSHAPSTAVANVASSMIMSAEFLYIQ